MPLSTLPAAQADWDISLLRCLLDIPGLLVVAVDLDGHVELFNRECERLTGFPAKEVVGRRLWDVLAVPGHASVVRNLMRSLAAGTLIEARTGFWRTRNGETLQVYWHYQVLTRSDGRVRRILATGQPTDTPTSTPEPSGDATQLQPLLDGLPVLAAELDRNYQIRFANKGYQTWFGLDPRAQIGKHIRDVIGRKAFAVLRPQYSQALAGRHAVYHGEVPYARGGPRLVHGNYTPRFDADGNVVGLYILAVDLSPQLQLRKRLATELRRSRTILRNALDGVITTDGQGMIMDFNPAAEKLFGYRASEVVGQNIATLMPQPHSSRHDDHIRRYVETGRPHIIGIGRELTARHKDGSPIELQLALAEFFEDGQRRFVGFTQDIRARKRAEREARETLTRLADFTRLRAISDLSASLAHEISQPLTAVNAAAQAGLNALQADHPSPAMTREALEQIHVQSQRANRIIDQLHGFQRHNSTMHASFEDVHALVREVLDLLALQIETAGIEVELDLMSGGCDCLINQVQIEQVIYNLVRNAIDALCDWRDPRILRIVTGRNTALSICTITVSDTGPGIPANHLDRLFDPFFTTKEQGFGQGLLICRSIIEAHDGSLNAMNAPGGGATFLIELPDLARADHEH